MANDYYNRQSEMNPGEVADGLAMEQEFDAIARGFAKLPTPHRDGGGFEGAVKVGDPVDSDDAVNLAALEALNLPIYRKHVTTEDWNTLTQEGIYDVAGATGANKPSVYNFGVLHVYNFNGVAIQIYYPDNNDTGVLAKRTCQNVATNDWLAWAALLPTDALAARVTALEGRKSTCLVNATGTGAPHETVSATLPANISNNNKYDLDNPFGASTPVWCKVQLNIANGGWFDAGWDGNSGTGSASFGARAVITGTGKIRVITGTSGLDVTDNMVGSGSGLPSGSAIVTSARCRVSVRRMDD